MTPIDPATIRVALPKPGGREALLLREVPDLDGSRIEITLARVLPGRGYHALRSIGVAPSLRDAFSEAVGSLRNGKSPVVAATTPPEPATGFSGAENESDH